jgi:uncharacterized protein (UPF0332 family)
MFNVARAALLNSGVPESKLPKTHNGLIAAFGEEAVKARKLDPNLGRALSKTESLRLMADYTGHQIDQPTAEGAVARAELFIRTVEREFGLEGLATQPGLNPDASKTVDEKNQASSVPDHSAETSATLQPLSLEETQRNAALKWRRDYYDRRASGLEPDLKPAGAEEKSLGIDKTHPGLDTGLDFDPED